MFYGSLSKVRHKPKFPTKITENKKKTKTKNVRTFSIRLVLSTDLNPVNKFLERFRSLYLESVPQRECLIVILQANNLNI